MVLAGHRWEGFPMQLLGAPVVPVLTPTAFGSHHSRARPCPGNGTRRREFSSFLWFSHKLRIFKQLQAYKIKGQPLPPSVPRSGL